MGEKVEYQVFYRQVEGGKWIDKGKVEIDSALRGVVNDALDLAFRPWAWAEMEWQVRGGIALQLAGRGMLFGGSALTFAACLKWGRPKWWVAVPALAGAVSWYGGVRVHRWIASQFMPFVVGEGGDQCLDKEGKNAMRAYYQALGLKEIAHVAVEIQRDGANRQRLPVWVIEKGE